MNKGMRTSTLADLLVIASKRDLVRDHFRNNYYNKGLMSDEAWKKFDIGLSMTNKHTQNMYKLIVEDCVDKGECPQCHSLLSVIVTNTGYDYEQQHLEANIIECNSCGWKE